MINKFFSFQAGSKQSEQPNIEIIFLNKTNLYKKKLQLF